MSLTAINVAKITSWIPKKDKNPNEKMPFSMADIKTLYNNRLYLDRIIAKFGINPELKKNKSIIEQLLSFGKLSA